MENNIKPMPIQHIDKPWGYEEILETNVRYTVKRLFMKKGYKCSYQYHEYKMETIICLVGKLTIITDSGEIILDPEEAMTIQPMQKHRMYAKEEDCLYMECSTSELDDVIRLEDDYGRS